MDLSATEYALLWADVTEFTQAMEARGLGQSLQVGALPVQVNGNNGAHTRFVSGDDGTVEFFVAHQACRAIDIGEDDARFLNTIQKRGDTTVADAYLFTVLRWSERVKLDISKYAGVTAYMARVAARPKVQEAMKAEGLIQ